MSTHVADKGRKEIAVPVATPDPATGQVDQAAMTYVDDGNGNIIPGPDVGVQVQAEQPAAVSQPAETVVADAPEVKAPVVTDNPVTNTETATAQATAPYLYDWNSGISFNDAYAQNKHTRREIMDDQQRWARETGNTINYFDWGSYPEHDVKKTKEDNEKELKKAERKAKWDALGTFLTHLGNAVGAAGWGGSVKLHDPVELSERQRQIFERTQALRRARNKELMDAYMKQYNMDRQARLDATKAENEKRKLDRLDEDQRLRVKKQDWLEQYQHGILDDKAERRRIDEEYKKGLISLKERNSQIAELNAITSRMRENRQAAGNTVEVHKSDGSVETKVTTPNTNKASGNGSKGKAKSAFGSRTSGKSAFGKR